MRCFVVRELIGINRAFPPACFRFAEDVFAVDIFLGVLGADCGDVSLSPPPPLAKEKPDFDADDVCGDVSLSPPPPLANEKLDFDGEVYDGDDEAFVVDDGSDILFTALFSLWVPATKC